MGELKGIVSSVSLFLGSWPSNRAFLCLSGNSEKRRLFTPELFSFGTYKSGREIKRFGVERRVIMRTLGYASVVINFTRRLVSYCRLLSNTVWMIVQL